MPLSGTEQHRWWKEATVYQVYPSSFKDTNDDGWGDVKGITSKVDYLKELGVDVVWVSPIYKSPQADMGYDIADYKAIDPIYGSIEDVDDLIAELKKRGMKLMMDLVANHTSNQHSWFLESKSSLHSPKRSWYIWKPPRGRTPDGKPIPPNNWAQLLGEANSAWTYDPPTDEFYLSLFSPEQPDLNWENPDVRAAVHDIMHFWLKRGVAGYRMDVINLISKVQDFPDGEEVYGPGHDYQPGLKYFVNGPRLHEFLQDMNREVLSHYDSITVGEMPGVSDVTEILRTVGSKAGELDMIFIFDIVNIDNDHASGLKHSLGPWTPRDLAGILTKWQRAMIDHDGWNSLFLENHDQPRSISRYADDSDALRTRSAKLLALLQTTLAGTLFVYQGEELGMRNAPASWHPETDYKDIESLNFWRKSKALHGSDPAAMAQAQHILARKARDHSRTPVQWTAGPNAGFCAAGVKPWMRVNDDYLTINAEAQLADGPHEGGISVFRFWAEALARRKAHRDVFVYGDYELLTDGARGVFAYKRTGAVGGRWVIALNFSGVETVWDAPKGMRVEWEVGNLRVGKPKREGEEAVKLEPWEGILGKLVE